MHFEAQDIVTMASQDENQQENNGNITTIASLANKEYIVSANEAFDHIVGAFPITLGKATSKRERNEKHLGKDNNLVYGEITFEAFGIVFQKIKEIYGRAGILRYHIEILHIRDSNITSCYCTILMSEVNSIFLQQSTKIPLCHDFIQYGYRINT